MSDIFISGPFVCAHVYASMHRWNIWVCGRTCECFHASAVREDQCVRIDVVLPSAREVNGGGGGGGEGWVESGMRGAH